MKNLKNSETLKALGLFIIRKEVVVLMKTMVREETGDMFFGN